MTNRDRRGNAILLGVLSGGVLTVCFLYLSFIASIHGGLGLASLFFPFAVILSPSLATVTALAFLLASIQWPFYGFCLAVAWNKQIVLACLLVLIILHWIAVAIAFHRVSSVEVIRYGSIFVENRARNNQEGRKNSALRGKPQSQDANSVFNQRLGDPEVFRHFGDRVSARQRLGERLVG